VAGQLAGMITTWLGTRIALDKKWRKSSTRTSHQLPRIVRIAITAILFCAAFLHDVKNNDVVLNTDDGQEFSEQVMKCCYNVKVNLTEKFTKQYFNSECRHASNFGHPCTGQEMYNYWVNTLSPKFHNTSSTDNSFCRIQ